MATIYATATEYLANALTITRGSVDNITGVGVYHDINPDTVPTVEDFTMVTLVDGTAEPPDPLAETGVIDVLSLIGPRAGDVVLTPGDYQRWVLITTATEDIIRKVDVLEVL
ncbi:hypothetical protein E1295_31815 [Nonomuraea mesophila]|uniref:Uncharacterized protein n=1 Tax=Nonomuraea mesophila TaxID=2530382 RepID=A0A4R5EZC2_9ACTN|nr:hypothetical protein [Nonomuraea mesophila]TDE40488.1 hypothetical protein E1295_31815 [Nonomuraea mesophila]